MGLDVEVQMFHLPSAAPITWNENEFRVPAPNIIATTPGTVTLPPGVSSRAALTLATVSQRAAKTSNATCLRSRNHPHDPLR